MGGGKPGVTSIRERENEALVPDWRPAYLILDAESLLDTVTLPQPTNELLIALRALSSKATVSVEGPTRKVRGFPITSSILGRSGKQMKRG
jgi:hypothetical protein